MSNALLKLPQDARERVRKALGRGEVVLWAGRPRLAAAIPAVVAVGAFGLFWTGFCVMWEAAALHFLWDATFGPNRSRTPPAVAAIMAVFGLPFVAVGLGMLWKPVDLLRRVRTMVYVVTTQRLITMSGARAEVETTLPGSIRAVRRSNAHPAIARWFGQSVVVSHGRRRDSDGDLVDVQTRLEGLDDAAGAEAALLRIARPLPSGEGEPALA